MDINQKIQQIIWDYKVTPDQFLGMLNDEPANQLTRDKKWALTRLLERADFYTTISLVDKQTIGRFWPEIKPNIRFQHIKDGYDYFLSR